MALSAACRRRAIARWFTPPAEPPLRPTLHGAVEAPLPSREWTPDPQASRSLYTIRVAFEESFAHLPRVVVGLSGLELDSGPAAKLDVRVVPGSITRSGFAVQFSASGEGNVLSASAFWLALAQ